MSFREELERDLVRSLPISSAIAVHTGTVVRAAVALMRTHSMGCAVIVDHACVPIGIFTERSVVGLLFQNASLDSRSVHEFADPKFFKVKESAPISQVWNAMRIDGVRFACVTDDSGKLIGITGQRGVSEYVADCFAPLVTAQRYGSTPWMLEREGA